MTACRRKPAKQPPHISSLNYATAFLPMARFAIFLFSFFLLHHRVSSDIPPKEKTALLAFIKNVRLPIPSNYSWKDKESEPVCDNWKGVECDPSKSFVVYLRLPGASVVGNIPPETIGSLSGLTLLSLHDNGLTGDIPHDISNHAAITHLILHNNKFTGQLPAKEFAVLNVSNNNFTGTVPPSLSKLPKSAFSGNINLCGAPLPACKNGTSLPSPPPASSAAAETEKKTKKKSKDKRVIVGVSVGSAVLLLVLLCCLRKKIDKKSKQSPKLPLTMSASVSRAGTSAEGVRSKLVFFDVRRYSFDLDDLYQASPEVLGEGSVGTSYKVAMERGTTVVLKRLKDFAVTKEEFVSRMEVLGKMKNENLVPLLAYYFSKDEKLLVYDYFPAGSLSSRLHGSRGSSQTPLDWAHRMRIALAVARGVAYLHVAGNVVHGNIKSSNILLQQDALVSEFGLTTLFDGSSSVSHRVSGYLAPEVLHDQKLTFKSDVYAFGVLLLELLTGKALNPSLLGDQWRKEEWKTEVFDVELMRYENIEKEMSQVLKIAVECVSTVPDQRPSIDEVVRKIEDINQDEAHDPSK